METRLHLKNLCLLAPRADGKEVVELTGTLESMNSELLEMMKDTEQQGSEAQLVTEQDKNTESSLIAQLRSSVERERKAKEQIIAEVSENV